MTIVELSLIGPKQPEIINNNKMPSHHNNYTNNNVHGSSDNASNSITTHGHQLSNAIGRMPIRKTRRSHGINLHIPHSIHDVSDNYFVQALSQTTLLFCRETTLHGMKHVVDDIEELGSTFSR